MKFTKEDACKELVKQIPTEGETLNLSERSINSDLETLIPLIANDETELADFIEKVLPTFKTHDANIRNEVSRQVREYQEKNPPVEKKKPEDKTPEESPNKEMEERIRRMEEELAESKREKTIMGKRAELISKLNEKGVKDKDWIDAFLKEIPITEDLDTESKATSILNFYNKSRADYDTDWTPKVTGGGKSQEERVNETIKAAAALVKEQQL